MRPLEVYKHVNNKEVALLPLVVKETSEGLEVKCKWLNIVNSKNVFVIEQLDTIFIKQQDITKWRIYESLQDSKT